MSWMPLDSLPTKLGWKSTSGLLPIVTTLHMAPKVVTLSELWVVGLISVLKSSARAITS